MTKAGCLISPESCKPLIGKTVIVEDMHTRKGMIYEKVYFKTLKNVGGVATGGCLGGGGGVTNKTKMKNICSLPTFAQSPILISPVVQTVKGKNRKPFFLFLLLSKIVWCQAD